VSGPDGSITGEETVLALRRLRLDFAFLGCSGIEPGGAVMDFDPGKIAVKRSAMAVARRAVLVATTDKFGRTARAEIAPLESFAVVLRETDAPGCRSAEGSPVRP
jgi:DeoR family glycerol-3-phosphate regulon repressor